MSDSQETQSSGSTFRDDRDDVDVVDKMYDATDQMGEDMPIGLGGNFEYRGVRGGVRGEEVRGAKRGEEGGEAEDREEVIVAVASSGGVVERSIGMGLTEEGWSVDEYPSTMKKQKLDRLRDEYAILSSVRLRAPTEDEKSSMPPLGGSAAVIFLPPRVDESVWCSPTPDEPKSVQDHGKCPGVVVEGAWVRADHKSDAALFFVEEESVLGRLLLPSECGGEDD
ncbi:hypothetical protein Pyn_24996 [Prunus yedoensis var. nudiflora]|uniref:Uncharacterized protein n=1 Tax=Prunus yedoensis var. nudiflora TaxID=2094558 RepID=A0A314YFB6_PRUYE|nr:hypothetical protein Pyn_24996 [Prunus yedoensis var. nudiflora]